jgi:hypothetical protein
VSVHSFTFKCRATTDGRSRHDWGLGPLPGSRTGRAPLFVSRRVVALLSAVAIWLSLGPGPKARAESGSLTRPAARVTICAAMALAVKRLVVAASTAAGLSLGFHLLSSTERVERSAPRRAPAHATVFGRTAAPVPRARVAGRPDGPPRVQRLPRKAVRTIGADSESIVYSIENVGDVPVSGGYAAVAYDLGIASSGSRLR